MPELRIAGCSHEAAKFAVLSWHYSRTMPIGKIVKVGAWEEGEFVGAVLFSRGACANIGKPYGLSCTECVELTRVALGDHESPTSQIVAGAVRCLRELSPGLRLLVSYADMDQGHFGTIYQAMNWIYVGEVLVGNSADYVVRGRKMHNRTVNAMSEGKMLEGESKLDFVRRVLDPSATRYKTKGRHKYLLPLDRRTRKALKGLAKPYPKELFT